MPIDAVPTPPNCQLVIPCYRDGQRLAPFLGELGECLPEGFSLQIVDDGSGADEARALAEVVARARAKVSPVGPQIADPVFLATNRGKGAAVRAGWKVGMGRFDFAGFADADGAVTASEILRGFEFLRERPGLDGVLGSRLKVLGHRVERRFWRHLSGRIFATAVSEMSRLPVYDTQCGFKLFRSSAVAEVLPLLRSERFAFDVELILELVAAGARLREFPVDWTHVNGSKISVLREMLPMLWDVWKATRRVRLRIK